MPASLQAIEEKLGQKRRLVGELVAKRNSAFEALDVLSAAVDSLQAIETPTEDQSKDLSAKASEHKAKFGEITSVSDQIRNLENEISTLESEKNLRAEHNRQEASLIDSQRRQATPENPSTGANSTRVNVLPPTNDQLDKDLTDFFRCSYLAKANGMSIRAVASGELDDKHDASRQYGNERLAATMLQSANPAVIPSNYIPRLIELLRPKTVIRNIPGVRQIPLPNGNLRLPRQSGSSSAAYIGEMVNIAKSTPTTDQITLSAKKLTTLVVQSGELMRHSSPSTDQMIRDDIIQTIARKEDVTFIRDAGSATNPKGLKAYADVTVATQVITATVAASATVAAVTRDLGKLILALSNVDTPMIAPAYIMAPRSEQFLLDMRDANGNYAFPEMQRGKLRSFPYFTTTQIPINLGVGTNKSEIYFFDATELIIGDTPTMELQVSMEAAYHDGTNVQAAFSQDAVVFRLIKEHDTAIRHPLSVAYLKDVEWGT